jgi:hypothetical protein
MCNVTITTGGFPLLDHFGGPVKFKEFEASTHLTMSSDDVYRIASDPSRIDSWIPRDLAPAASSSSGKKASAAMSSGSTSSGVTYDAAAHRMEWSAGQDHCETWLEVRSSGGESDVTIHLSAPEGNTKAAQLQQQLEQALHRLEVEANRGLSV